MWAGLTWFNRSQPGRFACPGSLPSHLFPGQSPLPSPSLPLPLPGRPSLLGARSPSRYLPWRWPPPTKIPGGVSSGLRVSGCPAVRPRRFLLAVDLYLGRCASPGLMPGAASDPVKGPFNPLECAKLPGVDEISAGLMGPAFGLVGSPPWGVVSFCVVHWSFSLFLVVGYLWLALLALRWAMVTMSEAARHASPGNPAACMVWQALSA